MNIHRSNHTERLVDGLAELLATPSNPLAPDLVLVHSSGIGTWLEQRLADRMGFCANVLFLQPMAFIEHLLLQTGWSKEDSWGQTRLVWTLYDELFRHIDTPGLSTIKAWSLEDGAEYQPRRLADLALDLGPRFERYALYRPHETDGWTADGEWQHVLWSALRQRRPSLGEQIQTLRQNLDGLHLGRIAAFCPGTLPPLVLSLLEDLDASLFLLRPRTLTGHPLMASLGGQAAAFDRLLDEHLPHAPRHDHFVNEHADGLVGALQRDLNQGSLEAAAAPTHLRVHACGGAWRQVEVLRDVLHEALEDRTLEARDILVMTTDVERFGPMVGAALDLNRGPNSPPIPYRLADTSLRSRNTAAAALLDAVELVQGRFDAGAVMDLLARPEVATKWGFGAADLEACRSLVAEASIHWGRDREHRQQLHLPAIEDFTWRLGLDRMLLALISDRASMGLVPAGVGRDGLIEGLVPFLEGLVGFHDQFADPQDAGSWEALMLLLLEHLCGEEGWKVRAVREVLREVAEASEDCDRELPLSAWLRMLEGRFSLSEAGKDYLAGGVTVCAMVPMRSIPFRVVCLLGMDEDAYPRQGARPRYDLMAGEPEDGDVEPRRDDRALLLETLLSTRQRLEIFTTSRAPRDGTRRPPAVPISELLDVVEQMSPGARKAVVVEHPLQPHDPRVFAERRSFDPVQYAAAVASLEGRKATRVPHRFLDTPLDAPEPSAVELYRLVGCLKNPMKHFCTRGLGLYLEEQGARMEDHEPLEYPDDKDYLAWWALKDAITRALIEGLDPVAELRSVGRIPAGTLGENLVMKLRGECEALADQVRPLWGPSEARRVELEIDGWRLWGNVIVRGGRVVCWTPSSANAKHRLEPGVMHLALSAAGVPPDDTCLFHKKGVWHAPPVAQAAALDRLRVLLEVYRDALRAPLLFEPSYSEAMDRGWQRDWKTDDPHQLWVLGDQAPDDDPLEGVVQLPGRSFAELATTILGSLP